jgi:flagellar biosynthesis/type III secretory pathway M-ring protein FliF/YscJ
MKFNFRYLVYSMVLIGFVTFTFTLCSKHAVHPLFQNKSELQDGIVFQRTHEAKIKANLERFLEKLMGKKMFVVSVLAELNDKHVNEIIVEKEPVLVSKNNNVFMESSYNEKSADYLVQRPSFSQIKERLVEPKPAEFSYDSLLTPVIDLPGFPNFSYDAQDTSTVILDSKDDKTQFSSSKDESSLVTDLVPKKELTLIKQNDFVENSFLVNQKTIQSEFMKNKIKRIMVSIVIDEDYYSYLDIDLIELEALVSNVSGINIERGDEINVSFIPFVNKGFSWTYFVKQNKVVIDKLLLIYNKIKPILIIFVVIALLGGGWFLLKFLFFQIKKILSRREIKKVRQEKKEEAKIQEEKMSEIEEKKQALIQLAQTKPDQFNMLINSWVEVDKQ